MAFKMIIPRLRCEFSDIRVSFTTNKIGTTYANVYFSYALLDTLKWTYDDRVFVYVDDKQPSFWLIKKAKDNEENTFRLYNPNKTQGNKRNDFCRVQFKFSESSVIDGNCKIKPVNYEIKDNELLIKLF